MRLDARICEKARLARDHRFDGLFFTGVQSTGIFCRPICPARPPNPENIVYFLSAAAALEAGFRPCLRCRPETSPGSPAWNGTSVTVARAMLLIRQGALDEGSLEDLAAKLGIGGRHLRRLFQTHLGASPKALVTTQKVLFAKKLLDETDLPITQIAFAAGFGSIRRFNAAFSKYYATAPSHLRRRPLGRKTADGPLLQCRLSLPYRPPFDWPCMLAFLEARAILGVEFVAEGAYYRTIRINATCGAISVTHAPKAPLLRLTAVLSDSRDLMAVVERVRRMFDLDANMAAIHQDLRADPILERAMRQHPGLRLPGAWDPFEVAVRAVVGQQISVRGARTLMGRIAASAGPRFDAAPQPQLTHFFPSAQELSASNLGGIGMPARRVETLQALTSAVVEQKIRFAVTKSVSCFIDQLTRIPGIGDWTAQYVAMRGLGEPDAFPAADLGLARALQQDQQRPTVQQVRQRAEKWRPWRAYAAMFLWHAQRAGEDAPRPHTRRKHP